MIARKRNLFFYLIIAFCLVVSVWTLVKIHQKKDELVTAKKEIDSLKDSKTHLLRDLNLSRMVLEMNFIDFQGALSQSLDLPQAQSRVAIVIYLLPHSKINLNKPFYKEFISNVIDLDHFRFYSHSSNLSQLKEDYLEENFFDKRNFIVNDAKLWEHPYLMPHCSYILFIGESNRIEAYMPLEYLENTQLFSNILNAAIKKQSIYCPRCFFF